VSRRRAGDRAPAVPSSRGFGTLRRIVRSLVRLLATVLVAGLGIAAVGAAAAPEISRIVSAHDELAAPLPEFSPLPQRSIVYDVDGNIIDILRVENREPFTIDQVPAEVIDAFLAVEDETFYEHPGVNGKSLLRALLTNVSAGEITQGGSTITQQLVKNGLVGFDRDAERKVLEAAYAVRLEREWTKDQILERYLNTVYFGNNAYGLQAAAETYFGKNVAELAMIEGAFLAGMVRNPVGYDPILRPERSRNRFRQVVERLVATGEVSETEEETLAETWKLPDRVQRSAQQTATRSYFSAKVRDILLNETDILGPDYDSRYNALFRGGLQIYTTLDPRLQAAAEFAKSSTIPDTQGRFDAAMTVVNTKTGAVRAMVGGPGFERSQVNLATSTRQSGSSIKIFILVAALEAGVQPNDLIDGNTPCTLPDPNDPKTPFEIDDAVDGNIDTITAMTYRSINCAYARLSQIVGLNRVIESAKRLGVRSPLQPLASFATGANEVSTVDMASGVATIGNRGAYNAPYYVERIEDRAGRMIYQHAPAPQQVLDPGLADTAVDIMKNTLTRGTGTRGLLAGERPAFGKTGTQEDNTNAWFAGATTEYAAAVWMGDPNGYTPMIRENAPEYDWSLTRGGVQGGMYPVMVWKAFMDAAHTGLPTEDWPEPPSLERRAARLYLPGDECTAIVANDPAIGEGKRTPTTIPPNVLDPAAPVPSVPAGAVVYNCKSGPPPPPTTVPAETTTSAETTVADSVPATDAPPPSVAPTPPPTQAPPPTQTSAPPPPPPPPPPPTEPPPTTPPPG
jgi:penicillin-binding protein 1A